MDKQVTFLRWVKMTGFAALFVLSIAVLPGSTAFAADASSGNEVDVCEEPAVQTGIERSNQAYVTNALQTNQEAIKSRMKQFQKNPIMYHLDIGDSMCIKRLLLKQKEIARQAGKNSTLEDFFWDMLEDIANQACDYVASNIDTALNNALNLMCIPIPNLGYFTLELPSLERTSCDGVSLANYMKFTPVTTDMYYPGVPESYMSAPFMRSPLDIQSGSSVGITSTGW